MTEIQTQLRSVSQTKHSFYQRWLENWRDIKRTFWNTFLLSEVQRRYYTMESNGETAQDYIDYCDVEDHSYWEFIPADRLLEDLESARPILNSSLV